MKELEAEIKQLYPAIKIYRVLNRRHESPPEALAGSSVIPVSLQNFYNERLEKERARVAGISFDFEIFEGSSRWIA
jgi:hypothetical protein